MIPEVGSLQAMRFAELLDQAARLLRRGLRHHFWPLAVVLAGSQLMINAISVLWSIRSFEAQMQIQEGTKTPWEFFTGMFSGGVLVVGCLAMVIALGVQIVSMGAVSRLTTDAVLGRDVGLGAAWRFGLKPGVLGTWLLVGLLTFAAVLVCCVGVLYAIPALAMVGAVMVAEGSFGWQAVRRSHELARFNPQRRFFDVPMVRILILLLAATLIQWLASMIVSLPMMVVQQIAMLRAVAAAEGGAVELPTGMFWLQIPLGVLTSLIQTATLFYIGYGVALLFVDTRRRKEAPDLEDALREIEGRMAPESELPG